MTKTFIALMLKLSAKKMLRDKFAILTEFFEFGLALTMFFALYQINLFDQQSFIYMAVALQLFVAIQSGTKLGITLINHKNQGFLQELYSSPLSTAIKMIGLTLESFAPLLAKTTFLLFVYFILDANLTILQIATIYLMALISALLTSYISIIISSKTNNIQLVAISMSMLGLLQIVLGGLIIKAAELPIIYANPYSYIADLFLHASNTTPNYPLILNIIVIALLLGATHMAAVSVVENTET